MHQAKRKRISTIVFDFDGTLADTFEITAAAIAFSSGVDILLWAEHSRNKDPGMEAYQFWGRWDVR